MRVFEIYTKPNCSYCSKAKSLISSQGDKYIERRVNEDITREELLAKFPNARTVPQISESRGFGLDENIGGYTELVQFYENIQAEA